MPSPAPAAPANSPRILEIDLNSQRLSSPGVVSLRVLTSADVSTLTAQMLGHHEVVPKLAASVFGSNAQLPSIPFFLKGKSYDVQFVATTDDGRSTTATVSVYLNR